ncbi:hypothetical protein ACNFJ7_02100 [Sphingomonas sp. HT-1]|uniref:hypothetical protein n=1 Tax=unclassified Sphingomonas TaxID=196159 RepID=UPI00031D98AC|nr:MULTISPECIES: hypothetical protein [unclassified Sphingomonas]KTF68662.1 hypothetical protein ATB93_13130 [Sphingomonas sp. WG]
MAEMICRDCSAPISRQSKTGRCKSCSARHLNASPELTAKRLAAIERYYAQPGVRERHAARFAEYNRNIPDEHREMRRQHGLRQAREVLARPDVLARSNSPEAKRKAGAARTERTLGWCPAELRDQYRQLCASQRLSAAEARRIIEAEIPGTAEHGKRVVASHILQGQLRHERRQREAY